MMKTKNKTVTLSGAVCGLILAGYGVQAQNLFVGSYGSESIVEFAGGKPTTFATGLDYPTGLAFDSSGDLFESDQFSGHIYEWAAGGTTRTTFASGLNQPNFMAFNTSGDLFVSVGTAVNEYNSFGTIINTITSLTSVGGLAFDSSGNLYISSIGNGSVGNGYITKITPGGTRSTFASGLNYANGIAFNAAGDLFVADGNNNDTITEITPGGTESQYASGLANPFAIAFDNSGNMFVVDEGGGGDITEFAPNGTKSVFSTSVSVPTSLAFEPVPEPSAYALFGLGLFALVARSCNRRQTA